MVDWNDVVHDWLCFSGVVFNLLLGLATLACAGYGLAQLSGSV
jgi:hypothetical protein